MTEGHLQCVWDLAERAARQMAADAVRIDIFLNPTSPQGCMLNEISLSSAMYYQQNSPYLFGSSHICAVRAAVLEPSQPHSKRCAPRL